jgi:hypothetical protein
MAIMPQIAMGFQMPQIQLPNQGNMLMQVAQLQQMQQANALRQAQARKLQLEEERGNALVQALRGGQPTLERLVAADPGRGFEVYKAFQEQQKAQREEAERQQEQMRKRQGTLAQTLFNLRDDPSVDSLARAWQTLKQGGMGEGLESTVAEMLLMTPEQRRAAADQYIKTTPGMAEYITGRSKEEEDIRKKAMETDKLIAQTDVERARLKGTLPRAEQQRLAPNIQTIADPTDPSQQLLVDVTQYKSGGGIGSPGAIGRPGVTREPAPVRATIQDPNKPNQNLVVDMRSYRGGGAGAPGVLGVAGEQAGVVRQENKQEVARSQLNDTLDTMSGLYDELNRLKGLTSQERGPVSNLASYVAGTLPGQVLGQAFGTQEQSVRDLIKSARFTLVQQIKNATGMSAQQLNSNFELQNALNALSDPQVGYEAATKIIDNLRKTYGLGGETPSAPASRGAAGGPAAAPAQPSTGAPIQLPKDNADAVYNSLPSGAQFIDPNGVLRRKP